MRQTGRQVGRVIQCRQQKNNVMETRAASVHNGETSDAVPPESHSDVEATLLCRHLTRNHKLGIRIKINSAAAASVLHALRTSVATKLVFHFLGLHYRRLQLSNLPGWGWHSSGCPGVHVWKSQCSGRLMALWLKWHWLLTLMRLRSDSGRADSTSADFTFSAASEKSVGTSATLAGENMLNKYSIISCIRGTLKHHVGKDAQEFHPFPFHPF